MREVKGWRQLGLSICPMRTCLWRAETCGVMVLVLLTSVLIITTSYRALNSISANEMPEYDIITLITGPLSP
jgi:hypothetical protein